MYESVCWTSFDSFDVGNGHFWTRNDIKNDHFQMLIDVRNNHFSTLIDV